jgi:hypothetical protein
MENQRTVLRMIADKLTFCNPGLDMLFGTLFGNL